MTSPAAVLLTPGAGSDRHHPALVAIEAALAPLPVERLDFPYRRAGRRAPDRAPKLVAAVVEAAQVLTRKAGVAPERLVLGGRSMGGRMCSMAVASSNSDGVAKGSFVPETNRQGSRSAGRCSTRSRSGRPGGCSG